MHRDEVKPQAVWIAAVFGVICSAALLFADNRLDRIFVHRPAVAELPDPFDPPPKPRPGWCPVCQVNEVIDGDTIDVSVSYSFRVRLLDCWAPESRGPEREAGLAAKRNLIALAADKDCLVEIPGKKNLQEILSLDRVLGRVWIAGDETDLSTHQVRSGHATRTKRGK